MEKQIQSSDGESPEYRHYFVDEAGDATIFGSRGQVLVGKEGCSRFFMLGIVDVKDPKWLAEDLASLRTKILADPYFKGVPSLQPEERKTALLFHAKEDLPEIRREVFTLLQTHELRFSAIVRDKLAVLTYVRRRNETDPSFRYNPNELYDYMVRRLFEREAAQGGGLSHLLCAPRKR
jgi:hypothetical protein